MKPPGTPSSAGPQTMVVPDTLGHAVHRASSCHTQGLREGWRPQQKRISEGAKAFCDHPMRTVRRIPWHNSCSQPPGLEACVSLRARLALHLIAVGEALAPLTALAQQPGHLHLGRLH